MWKELFIIILVICISYVFTISDRKYYDSQLMFIIAALFIIVIYKALHFNALIDLNKDLGVSLPFTTQSPTITESFTADIDLTKLSTWLSTTQANVNNMTQDQQADMAKDYSNIRQDLDTVKKLLQALNAQQSLASVSTPDPNATYDRTNMLNLASYQTLQNERIATLKNEIDKAKGTLNQITIAKGAIDYPKIPVYSSCVVSDAAGGYSSTGTSASTSIAIGGSPSISPSNAQNSSGILTQALTGLLSNGINVNMAS